MTAILIQKTVGPWPMNAYLIICPDTGQSAIVDPGAESDQLLSTLEGKPVTAILLTHGHLDHVGALEEVKAASGAPVYLHPAEAEKFGLDYDEELKDGLEIRVGQVSLRAIHTPGHTPGMTCFDLGDGRLIVGDTIFMGGPGRTWSPQDFETTIDTMQNIVFRWPDQTEFFPGHGPSGKIGEERPHFEAFLRKGWPSDLQGDVTWSGAG